MKKLIAMLLALVMVFSLVACGPSGNEDTNPSGNNDATDGDDATGGDTTNLFEEHVTLTYVFACGDSLLEYEGWQDIVDAVNAITEEKINATIEFELITRGEYTDKMNMKYIGGEEFDVCFTGAWNPYANAVAQGGYAELTWDMLNTYAADTVAILNEDCWDAVTVDGKIYAVPLQQIWVRQNSIRFNTETADKYGFDYTTVADLDDITPYLETLKQAGEQYILRMTDKTIVDNFGMYMGFDTLVSTSTPGAVYYAAETPVVVNQFASEEFLTLATQMKEWTDAGYIPEDILTSEVEGKLFAVDTNPALKPGGDASESASRGYNVVSMPIGDTALTTSGIVATNLAVGATSKNPERALAFINLLNTDAELLNLLCHGIEGVDYEFVDKENKVIKAIDGTYPGNYSFVVGNVFNEYYTDASQVGTWEETAEINGNAAGSCILGFSFNAEPVATEIAAMQAVIAEYLPALSVGQVDDVQAYINDMNAKLEAAGLSTVLAEMQAQIDAWYGA